METIREYIISVVSAGAVCSVVDRLMGKKSANSALIHMLCGIFMALTLVSPILEIRLDAYTDYFGEIISQSQSVAAIGQTDAYNELNTIIKANTEAYILDKADSLGLALDVEVTLNEDNPPVPSKVYLEGNIAPYNKKLLCDYITQNLGIPKEDQVWR